MLLSVFYSFRTHSYTLDDRLAENQHSSIWNELGCRRVARYLVPVFLLTWKYWQSSWRWRTWNFHCPCDWSGCTIKGPLLSLSHGQGPFWSFPSQWELYRHSQASISSLSELRVNIKYLDSVAKFLFLSWLFHFLFLSFWLLWVERVLLFKLCWTLIGIKQSWLFLGQYINFLIDCLFIFTVFLFLWIFLFFKTTPHETVRQFILRSAALRSSIRPPNCFSFRIFPRLNFRDFRGW